MHARLNTNKFATIIVCLLLLPAFASAQDFLVSKGRDALNTIPRAALNTSRGEVFVVWRGSVSGDFVNFEIYSALVKIRANGNARAKKARKVGRDDHNYFHFDVAYDPAENRYFVIWNGADEGDINGALFGQFFKANGKPDGDRFKILSDSQFEPLSPVITAVPENGVSPDGAHFLAAYSWYNAKIGDAEGNGLRCVFLDVNGMPIGTANEVFDSVLNTDNRPSVFINERLMPTLEGKFLLTTGHEIDKINVVDEPMIFQLFTFGDLHVSHTLDTDNKRFLNAVQLNKRRVLVFWRNGDQDNYYKQINPQDFSPRGSNLVNNEIGFVGNSELVKLQDDRGALQFVYRTTSIRVFYVNKKGKTQFPGIEDIELGKPMGFKVFAQALPDNNRVLLLHSLPGDAGSSEIRGLVYEPELP